MKFRLLELMFTNKVKVLVDDNWKTKDFDKKSMVFLHVGDTEINDISFLCGFISSPSTVPDPIAMRSNYDKLLNMDVDDRLKWIKGEYRIPSLKIPRDLISDRESGPGAGPIQMFRKGPELWAKK